MLRRLLAEAEATAPTSSRTFGEAFAEFLAWKKPSLAPTTFRAYEGYSRREVLPVLGKVPLDQPGTAQIDALYSKMAKAGKSYHVIKQAHDVVRAAYSEFLRWGWVDRNVSTFATLPKAPNNEIAVPSVDQLRALPSESGEVDPQWVAMIALAAVTGMRRGELCGLRRSDLQGSTLTVRRSITYTSETGLVEGPTKTRPTRRIALDEFGIAVIEAQVAYVDEMLATLVGTDVDDTERGSLMAEDPFVFVGRPEKDKLFGATPIHPDSISMVFRRIADKHGWRDLHFHSLRHFTATQLIAAGVDVRTVSGRLGHSTPTLTLRTYSHVLEAQDRQAAAILGGLLGNKLGEAENSERSSLTLGSNVTKDVSVDLRL